MTRIQDKVFQAIISAVTDEMFESIKHKELSEIGKGSTLHETVYKVEQELIDDERFSAIIESYVRIVTKRHLKENKDG